MKNSYPKTVVLSDFANLSQLTGGFLILPEDRVANLGPKVTSRAIARTIELGSLEYWQLVLHSQSHGFMKEGNMFTIYYGEDQVETGEIDNQGKVRLNTSKDDHGLVVRRWGNLLFVETGKDQTQLWVFVADVKFKEPLADPAGWFLLEVEFDRLICAIKERGL